MPQVASLPAVPRLVASAAVDAAGTLPSAVRRHLPPTDKLLYYAGLGALAVFDLVSWPVAATIGGGVWVASRARPTTAS
jgi:hypothetical protein